jgi:hypothetical protein
MKIDIVVRLDNFHRDAVWKGNDLIFHGRVVASVVLDAKWPRLWRVGLPDGHTTDMVNLSRARDAARSLALKALAPGLVGASPIRLNEGAATRRTEPRATRPPRIERTSGRMRGRAGRLNSEGVIPPVPKTKNTDGTVALSSAKKF